MLRGSEWVDAVACVALLSHLDAVIDCIGSCVF